MPTPPSNPIQVVSDFYFQNLFENSMDAVVVLQLQPAITLFTANQRARQWFDWPADSQSPEFAKQILHVTGLSDEARQLASVDEVAAIESASRTHLCQAGVVEWTPFQNDNVLYVLIALKLDGRSTGSESSQKTATTDHLGQSMNSMAVAYWLKTFIHQVSQPLHVNQNTADIIQIEAEQNLIDSQTIRPRLERMQFAGNLLRECLSDLRKQLQLMSIEFSKINLHNQLTQLANQFENLNSISLKLQFQNLDQNCQVHGDASLLDEAIRNGLNLVSQSMRLGDQATVDSGTQTAELQLIAENSDGQVHIKISPTGDNSLAYLDVPIMKQAHSQLISTATWGVCESIVEMHHGELRHVVNEKSDLIQIRLPEASESTSQPNLNVTLHKAWAIE
ncbi:hypothetical protein SH528x_002621 [Novipirellula sp. SH528]|uniref:hypothetical protein n=1 Tax=Novipirellula sp. SH528 TaxID=3454466 RepID=UPI003FA082B2